jgi:predicted transcriptional regulator
MKPFKNVRKNLKNSIFEVLVAVLQFAKGNRKKTSIISHCNLDTNTATKIIDWLTQNDLLEKKGEYYLTTAKGADFLEGISEIEKLDESLDKRKNEP